MGIYLGIGLSLLASLSWGVNSIIMKKASTTEEPGRALVLRSVSAAPALFILSLFFYEWSAITRMTEADVFWLMVGSATTVAIGDFSFIASLKKIPVTISLPIASSYPLFGAMFILALGLQPLDSFLVIWGTILIVFGVGLIAQQSSNNEEDVSSSRSRWDWAGISLALFAAIFWGLSIMQLQILLKSPNVNGITLTFWRTLIIAMWGYGVHKYRIKSGNFEYAQTKQERDSATAYFLLSGILGWVIGAAAFMYAIQMIGALIATPLSATNTLIATLLGVTVLHEKVTILQLVGIIMVVIGSILVTV